jgi:ABC-2 type transport system ATP-binding protein
MTLVDGDPIRISDLRAGYGGREVLSGLDLTVRRGEIFALLGGNGSGKSTTLMVLLGLLKPSGGTIRVAGFDPIAEPRRARAKTAYIPESVALYDHLSAWENAEYFLGLADVRVSRAELENAFGDVGLPAEAWRRRVTGFSKGMRQKTALAVALLRRAEVLLLDEPTSGLDPGAAADFNALIGRLREGGAAVLMVTHDLFGAVDAADRLGFLEAGRLAETRAAEGPERFDIASLHSRFSRARAA